MKKIEAKIARLKKAALAFKDYHGERIPTRKIRELARAIVDIIKDA